MILQAHEYEQSEQKPGYLQEFYDSTEGVYINSYNAELFCINHGNQRVFFIQFEIIINVLAISFWLIWIPMLWVYDHEKYFNCFMAGIVFIHQNLQTVLISL